MNREWCAAEVGVQQDTRGVDHGLQQCGADVLGDGASAIWVAGCDRGAGGVDEQRMREADIRDRSSERVDRRRIRHPSKAMPIGESYAEMATTG